MALKHSSPAVKYICAASLKMHDIHIWRWREWKRVHTFWWLDIFPSYFSRSESGAVYLIVSSPSCFIMTILVCNFCCYFKTYWAVERTRMWGQNYFQFTSCWTWILHAVAWKCDKNVQLLMDKLIDALPQLEWLLGPHQSVRKQADSPCYDINES